MPFAKLIGVRKRHKRVFVLGLDGVPYSMLKGLAGEGHLPNLAYVIQRGGFARLNSVLPTVSSVAWTSYTTGTNPAKHNIFGFIDRRPNPFELYLPTSLDIKRPTLWEILSSQGRKVIAINVPISYPPKEVNGVMIGCFLTPTLEKGVYPGSLVPFLREVGYRFDVDASKARTHKEEFLSDLFETLKIRFKLAFSLMDRQQWDLFQLHVMGTDRINHFFWDQWENQHGSKWRERFLQYYKEIDGYVGALLNRLYDDMERGDTLLIVMSDHGFCKVKKEFNVNAWLMEEDFLYMPEGEKSPSIGDYLPETKAYSLIPGRIFVNLEGREQKGTVKQGKASAGILEQIADGLLSIRDPQDGSPVIKNVYRREDIYKGPFLSQAADLILEPHDGYELKAHLEMDGLFREGVIPGMHQRENAFLAVCPGRISEGPVHIVDIMQGILRYMGVRPPADLDGQGWS